MLAMLISARLQDRVILSICLTAMAAPAPALADDLWGALSSGEVDLYLRYRFEHVEDGQLPALEDANANTLRTALGYRTGFFHGFAGYLQFEDVRAIGNDLYNDGGTNGIIDRAAVVDPQSTEINQAYLSFAGLPNSELRAGRQEITHREDPLHRFLGNVLWRQNWQSFDAARFTSEPLPDASIDYSYIWNVNRIFGEDNPLPDRSDYRMDGHALKLSFDGLEWAALEAYGYLLDFESAASEFLSTATYGGRVQGEPALGGTDASLLYTAEFANQKDYGDNGNDIDVNYYLGELGIGQTFDSTALASLEVKASYEVLEGDGANAFQTPLGTNHAFQGWADRFLITPADGIEDLYGTLTASIYDTTVMIMYHDLAAENSNYDYGTEWDVALSRTFWDHYTFGLKYAAYDADESALNLARNGVASDGKQAFDLDKAWAWVEIEF